MNANTSAKIATENTRPARSTRPLRIKTGLRAGRREGDKDDPGTIVIIDRDGP